MYLMARKIKSMGIKMVLSGEGADEVFGGYLYFHKAPNKEELYKEDFNTHIDDELGDILKIKSYAESKNYILFSQDTIDSKFEGIEVVSSLREII